VSAPTVSDPVPFINEPWYCCAEPNVEPVRLV
jgi:hypothetical protein